MINKMWFCNHQYEILRECKVKDPEYLYRDYIV